MYWSGPVWCYALSLGSFYGERTSQDPEQQVVQASWRSRPSAQERLRNWSSRVVQCGVLVELRAALWACSGDESWLCLCRHHFICYRLPLDVADSRNKWLIDSLSRRTNSAFPKNVELFFKIEPFSRKSKISLTFLPPHHPPRSEHFVFGTKPLIYPFPVFPHLGAHGE